MGLPFHHKASTNIFENSRFLRKVETRAEKLLWTNLRNRNLLGSKFRRQHPIKSYILDFYCHENLLAIEIDGKIHETKGASEYDLSRTQELNSLGISVLRFTNEQVHSDIASVIQKIKQHINQ